MSSLSATQSDGYYLPPEYYDSGHYKKVSRNRFAVESEVGAQKKNNSNSNSAATKKIKIGHNQWLKHGIIRFELPEKVRVFSVSLCELWCLHFSHLLSSHPLPFLVFMNIFVLWHIISVVTIPLSSIIFRIGGLLWLSKFDWPWDTLQCQKNQNRPIVFYHPDLRIPIIVSEMSYVRCLRIG